MCSQTTPPSKPKHPECPIAEYEAAVSTYFKGVDIGIKFIQIFFVMNAALAAVVVFSIHTAKGSTISELKILGHPIIPLGACFFGLSSSILLYAITTHYKKLLDYCALRASQVEKTIGGLLFGEIYDATKKSGLIKPTNFIKIIAIGVMISWVLVFAAIEIKTPSSNDQGSQQRPATPSPTKTK